MNYNIMVGSSVEKKDPSKSQKRRSKSGIVLNYLELKETELKVDVGNPKTKTHQSLKFKRNGKTYYRWILHPEDEKYNREIIDLAEKKSGRSVKVQSGRFIGYLTASRSIIVHDTKNQAIFSYKSSTNKTGGLWAEKKMEEKDGRRSHLVNDYLQESIHKLKTAVIAREPIAMTLGNQGEGFSISVREYKGFLNKNITLVPVFSLLHPEVIDLLSDRLGLDKKEFLESVVFKPWGKALAELIAYFGIQPTSAHAQDYLIEFKNNKPTGRVIVRDIMDQNFDLDYLKAFRNKSKAARELLKIALDRIKKVAWLTKLNEYAKLAKLSTIHTEGRVELRVEPFKSTNMPYNVNTNDVFKVMQSAFIETYKDITKIEVKPSQQYDFLAINVERSFEPKLYREYFSNMNNSKDHTSLSCKLLF